MNMPNEFMPLEFLISALVTLLVVVDPVGLTPAFLSVTGTLPAKLRHQVALRACLIAGAIMIGTAVIGDWLLRQLGITLPAFRIAGGLLLFAVAFEMVLGLRLERSSKDAEQAVEEHWHHMAAFPLAIPLMAGPGAITATILLAGQAAYRPQWLAVLLFVIIVVMAACMASFAAAGRIGKLLGVTGNVVLTRLLGVVLAALAVQYVVDGVRAAFAA
jgi:multiple antibiotic resistance protein